MLAAEKNGKILVLHCGCRSQQALDTEARMDLPHTHNAKAIALLS